MVSTCFDLEVERFRLIALRAVGGADRTATLDDRLRALDAALADRRAAGNDPAAELVRRTGIDADALSLAWAIVAATIDPAVALQLGEPGRRRGLSLAELSTILGLSPERARALAIALPGSPLCELGLIEPDDPRPVTAATSLLASRRLITFLRGEPAIDPTLAAIAPPEPLILDPRVEELRRRIAELLASDPGCAVLVQGKPGAGRRSFARVAAGRPVVALDLGELAGTRAVIAGLCALRREVALTDAVPLVAGLDALAGADADSLERRRELARFVDRIAAPVFLVGGEEAPHLETARTLTRIELPLPGPRSRAAMWRHALGVRDDDPAIDAAALRFQLGPRQIQAAGRCARAIAGAAAPTAAHLGEAVRITIDERLRGLARRQEVRLGWDDVVLPGETREQIELLIARIVHAFRVHEEWGFARHLPGTGVSALFSGPPGTGKTMVAGVIARTLGLELYRVDLAQIVSKWIGETEKQLEQIFSAAETGHIALLFDEADSLFAKRTEVKGATERYANLEVNFLLQRLESFAGVAFLTTNMSGSLDPAFRRRLAAHIEFPQPDDDERAALWRRLLPAETPRARDLDLDAMAEAFPAFAGAHIRNALATAAFMAASSGRPLDQATLRRAAAEESHAMGRVVAGGGR